MPSVFTNLSFLDCAARSAPTFIFFAAAGADLRLAHYYKKEHDDYNIHNRDNNISNVGLDVLIIMVILSGIIILILFALFT